MGRQKCWKPTFFHFLTKISTLTKTEIAILGLLTLMSAKALNWDYFEIFLFGKGLGELPGIHVC